MERLGSDESSSEEDIEPKHKRKRCSKKQLSSSSEDDIKITAKRKGRHNSFIFSDDSEESLNETVVEYKERNSNTDTSNGDIKNEVPLSIEGNDIQKYNSINSERKIGSGNDTDSYCNQSVSSNRRVVRKSTRLKSKDTKHKKKINNKHYNDIKTFEHNFAGIPCLENTDDLKSTTRKHAILSENDSCNPTLYDTPSRKSSRLKSKYNKASPELPNRKQVLNSISSAIISSDENEKVFSCVKKRQSTSGFIYERNSYNDDTRSNLHDIDFSSEDDFIDDGEIEQLYIKQRKKKRKKKKEKTHKVSCENDQVDENKQNFKRKSTRRKLVISDASSEDEIKSSDEVSVKIEPKIMRKPTSRRIEKKHSKVLEKLKKTRASKKLPIDETDKRDFDDTDSESPEEEKITYNNLFVRSSDEDFIDDDGGEDKNINTSNEMELNDCIQKLLCKNPMKAPIEQPRDIPTFNRIICDFNDSEVNTLESENQLSQDEKQFFDYVLANNLKSITKMLTMKKYVNLRFNNKHTALHIAAMKGFTEMVEILIKNGSDLCSLDGINFTPICYAALHKFPNCFEYLLKNTETVLMGRLLRKYFNGYNLLHLILTVSQNTDVSKEIEKSVLDCINVVKSFNKNMFRRYVMNPDDKRHTPLLTAVMNKQPEVVRLFLDVIFENGVDTHLIEFPADEGENFLHFAAQHCDRCFAEIIVYFLESIDEKDINGFTPLMYAAELGNDKVLKILLENGASIHVKDKEDTSPLHLAAASGNLSCIQHLLDYKHPVNCIDKYGWPPLLYANFQATQSCVITLFNSNPNQIFCLSNLLHNGDIEQRRKNGKVIQETLLSISHIDAYYKIFNDFISQHLWLLDENDSDIFTKTWRIILSFENKVKWLRSKARYFMSESVFLVVDRENILQCAMNQLHYTFSINHMEVKFNGEEGSCLGPKREFFSCLVNDITNSKNQLLTKQSNQQYSLTPNFYFLTHLKKHLENEGKHRREMNKTVSKTLITQNQPSTVDDSTSSLLPTLTSITYLETSMANFKKVTTSAHTFITTGCSVSRVVDNIPSSRGSEALLLTTTVSGSIPSTYINIHKEGTSSLTTSSQFTPIIVSSQDNPACDKEISDVDLLNVNISSQITPTFIPSITVGIREVSTSSLTTSSQSAPIIISSQDNPACDKEISDVDILSALSNLDASNSGTNSINPDTALKSSNSSTIISPKNQRTDSKQSHETISSSTNSNKLLSEYSDISDQDISAAVNILDQPLNNVQLEENKFLQSIELETDRLIEAVDDNLLKADIKEMEEEITEKVEKVKVKTILEYKSELYEYLQKVSFVGQLVAQVILSNDINITMELTKPLIKQLLSIDLQHPQELDLIDHELFANIQENEMDDLELPFSVSYLNPWNNYLEEVLLTDNIDETITDKNKFDYLKSVSEFKVQSIVARELEEFKKGFYRSIRPDVISIFNADEFSLLLNGITTIDVDDWMKHTKYKPCEWPKDSLTVKWFWNAVKELKTEEKSLLLKFATGSPCVPLGGFKNIQGLGGGIQYFQIGKSCGVDKLPGASTCFNLLTLPSYSNESVLKEKLLIAIRHGCEGFTFS